MKKVKNIIDISVRVDGGIPVWPTASVPRFKKTFSLEKGHSANDSVLHMGVHTGTHIDAPSHFIEKGKTVDQLPIEIFMGNVLVVYLPKTKQISLKELVNLKIPKNTERILFRTSNSKLWGKGQAFSKNYVGITEDGARWLADKKIKLIGVDYLSVAKYDEAVGVHRILLGKGIVLLEGINLSNVKAGKYQLICLPVNLGNLEASPVRAVLVKK